MHQQSSPHCLVNISNTMKEINQIEISRKNNRVFFVAAVVVVVAAICSVIHKSKPSKTF